MEKKTFRVIFVLQKSFLLIEGANTFKTDGKYPVLFKITDFDFFFVRLLFSPHRCVPVLAGLQLSVGRFSLCCLDGW